MKKVLKGALAAALAIMCLGAVAGCSNGLTGGTAATVNGVDIPEDKVTQAIENMRKQRMLTTKSSLGEWMAEYSYIPQSLRLNYLETYINNEVLRQEAQAMGITVESSEVDDYVNQMRENYESDEKWQEALEGVGMTEDDYRENIENNLYKKGVEEQLNEGAPEDPELAYAQEHLAEFDGMRRSSHILFAEGDEATAQEVLDKINSGELDFAEAAETYSTDTGSASQGGDVGWSEPVNSFVEAYATALSGLGEGEVSGLVTSDYGTHIIKCTEVFNAPAELTSLDQLPEGIAEYVENQVTSESDTAYTDWLEEKRLAAEITINEMPEGVPYNINMTDYMEQETYDSLLEQYKTDEAEFLGEEVEEEVDAEAVDEAAGDETMFTLDENGEMVPIESTDGTDVVLDEGAITEEQPVDTADEQPTEEGGE